MHKAGVLDLLLYMAASDATREFGMHILEVSLALAPSFRNIRWLLLLGLFLGL